MGGTARASNGTDSTLALKLSGSSVGLHYIYYSSNILYVTYSFICIKYFKIILMNLWDPMKTNKKLTEV